MEAPLAPQQIGLSPAIKDFVAGGVGGMMGILAGQPLDTLRIRLQQRECTHSSISGVWRSLVRKEGTRALFKGMSYPLYTTMLQNAVTFQAQRAALRLLSARSDAQQQEQASSLVGPTAAAVAAAAHGQDPHVGPSASSSLATAHSAPEEHVLPAAVATVPWTTTCAAGMFAGAVQTGISTPVELLKIRQQLQREMPGAPGYMRPCGMLQRVLQQEGVRGLFRGFSITLLRDTPSYGLYFCAYVWCCEGLEAALRWAPPSMRPGPDNHSVQFLGGGLAGMVAWLSVYPVDVIKSRMQAHAAGASPYSSSWDCALRSWREEGSRVFVKGLGATMGRAFLVNAAIFSAFEFCMKHMGED